MGEECKYHFKGSTKYRLIFWKRNFSNKAWLISTGLNIVFELDCWQKSKDRAHSCFEISSMFWTAVHCFFSRLATAHLWMVRVIEGKIVPKRWSQRKPRLLPVSGRFELGRFRVTGSRLYVPICQFYTPVTATTMSCIFMPLSPYYMSSFTQILVKPGLNSMA